MLAGYVQTVVLQVPIEMVTRTLHPVTEVMVLHHVTILPNATINGTFNGTTNGTGNATIPDNSTLPASPGSGTIQLPPATGGFFNLF